MAPYFGARLPQYFPFWARSCETNASSFHWYVYSDHVAQRTEHNAAVTLIPMSVEEMRRSYERELGVSIVPGDPRKICDYRLLFYFIRRHHEPLERYDFVGFTDLDMLYGRIEDFLPASPRDYSVISADDGTPCGPFTMMHRSCMARLVESRRVREALEDPVFRGFDESKELLEVLAGGHPVSCRTSPLQPARAPGFNYPRASATWRAGRVTVTDDLGNHGEGAFYHFKRYKRLRTFRVVPGDESANAWLLDRRGIRATDATASPACPTAD